MLLTIFDKGELLHESTHICILRMCISHIHIFIDNLLNITIYFSDICTYYIINKCLILLISILEILQKQ